MSMSIISRNGRGRNQVTQEAVLVDSFQKGSAKRRAKTAAIVIAIAAPFVLFVIANAITSTATAALVAVVGGLGIAVVTFVIMVAWPVVRVLWHWAGEIVLAGVLAAIYIPVTAGFGGTVSAVVILAVVGVPFVFGPSRRFVIGWGTTMVMRHRLRTACDAFVEGKGVRGAVRPLILLGRPTPAGASIWMWLRGSLTLEDLQGRVMPIASMCWATRATAEAAGTKAAYARVDLYWRDPLADTIENPLVELAKEFFGKKNTDTPIDNEPRALTLDDIDDTEVETAMVNMKGSTRAKTHKRPGDAKKPSPAMTDSTGEDVADWI